MRNISDKIVDVGYNSNVCLWGFEKEVFDMPYIGVDVQDRMDLLGLTVSELADKSFLDEEEISSILNNEIALEEIDEFDLALICGVLHCKPEYFTNDVVRERDLLLASMNRGVDTEKSRKVKAKLQDFMNDFTFINGILAEVE